MSLPAQFHLELVSPESKLLSEDVWQVTVPGEDGDIGVRAGHMALVMSVRAGVVEITRSQNEGPTRFFVAGGFADIAQTHCTILAETAIPVSSLNAERLNAEVSELETNIAQAFGADRAALQEKLALAKAMLRAANV